MKRVTLGWVGVDTASLLITDPGYVGRWVDDDVEAGDLTTGPCPDDLPYSYRGAAVAHCTTEGGGPIGLFPQGQVAAGVVVSTGYGDGMYEVIAEVAEAADLDPDMRGFGVGRIARVIIDFQVVERQDVVRQVLRRSGVDEDVRKRLDGEV